MANGFCYSISEQRQREITGKKYPSCAQVLDNWSKMTKNEIESIFSAMRENLKNHKIELKKQLAEKRRVAKTGYGDRMTADYWKDEIDHYKKLVEVAEGNLEGFTAKVNMGAISAR